MLPVLGEERSLQSKRSAPHFQQNLGYLRGRIEVGELRPDDVVTDNLSSHKAPGVVEAIEKVGAEVRHLPPYSPDIDPIELAFSKFNNLLRDGANAAVTASGSARSPSGLQSERGVHG